MTDSNSEDSCNSSSQSPKLLVDWQAFSEGPATATAPPISTGNTSATCTCTCTATLLLDMHSELGEGILYDDLEQEIIWTDILGRQFHRLDLTSGKLTSYKLPKMLGSFALLDSSSEQQGVYLCAWQDGFQLYNPSTLTAHSDMSIGEDVAPHKLPTRLNDGRCDPTGRRFICGGFYGNNSAVKMKVYACSVQKADADKNQLIHDPLIDNVSVTNSLQFSPDGTTLYFADSPTRQIVAYDYNREASSTDQLLSNRRVLYNLELHGAVPDGSCVDADGYLWNATWWNGIESSRVRRIHPTTGKVVFEVHMPDATSQVSCCCFGGPNLDILFITTAAEGLPEQKEPHAGGLYAIKLDGVKGRLERRFKI